jgi:peptidoglycan-associated lipoprotein
MKRKLLICIFAALMVLQLPAKSQYVVKEADEQYNLYNYIKAIDLYEQAYAKKKTLHAAARLAESYSQIRNYKEAESWFAIAAAITGASPENVLGYAKALVNNSKYKEARIQFKNYMTLNKTVSPQQQQLWLQSCDSAVKWMQSPVSVTVQNVRALNSAASDWGAVKHLDMVTFTSDRGLVDNRLNATERPFLRFDSGKVPDKQVYGWTGNPYLRLYAYLKTAAMDSLMLFPFDAGTAYHIGAASFTADGKEMYFTLTRISKNLKYAKGGLATVNVEVYSSTKDENGNWTKPLPFKYNNVNEYSVGDPFISKDGKTLYFVSNMPGGKGGTDLYKVEKGNGGQWLSPVNFSSLNTPGDERSPSFDEAGNFYFSSDGLVGMGGLDIFKAQISDAGFSAATNLGYPVNSPQDDFAFNMHTATTGYLSSNRLEGMGDDDIYSITRQIIQAIKLEGRVYNKKTGLPLAEALVTLKGVNGQTLKMSTDDRGYYAFKIDSGISYDVLAEKTNFRSADTSFVTQISLIKDFYLIPVEINKPIRLENIYYDFDKANIRPDAASELDKLVKIMQDNPTMWIELGSHTDSRGDDQYNQWLSQRRANSAVQYIIDRGISKNRITAMGYGESQLLNRCTNGVKCSEAEHQLNRRTEFKIVKY